MGSVNPRTGQATLTPARQIPARIEEKQKQVRDSTGSEILATTRVMLVEEVKVGDRINGRPVVARENIVDVGGRVLGWTVFLT